MAGWLQGRVEVFVGITGSGKTTLARERQREFAARYGFPMGTLDLESAMDWAGDPHAESVDEVCNDLFVRRVSARVWTPRTREERSKFFRMVGEWGGVSLLIDGLPMIADAHDLDEDARQMLLRYRHGKIGPTSHELVAQRMSLIHRHVFAATTRVFVFRQAPGVDADRVYHEFDFPPELSTKLERGAKHVVEMGFPETPAPPAAAVGQNPGERGAAASPGGSPAPAPAVSPDA